jgi:hypothetical protein
MMTVIEVLIFDLAGITELWRALSFIGLASCRSASASPTSTCCPAHAHCPAPSPEPTAILSSPRNCIGTAVGSAKLPFDKFETGGPHADA